MFFASGICGGFKQLGDLTAPNAKMTYNKKNSTKNKKDEKVNVLLWYRTVTIVFSQFPYFFKYPIYCQEVIEFMVNIQRMIR